MTNRLTARFAIRSSALLALLVLTALAACKHSAQPEAGLKAMAAGTAIVESSGGHQVGVIGTALKDPLVV